MTTSDNETSIEEDQAVLEKWGNAIVRAFGNIGEKDAAIIRHAAEKGEPRALYAYGICLEKGLGGIAVSPGYAIDCFRHSAEKGHALAQNILGNRLFEGKAVPVDKHDAMLWWRKAADQGLALAANNWAWNMFLQTGDFEKWHLDCDHNLILEMAENMNDFRAKVLMGDYWLSCNAPDSEKAVKFFESASAAKSVGVLQFAKMELGISKLQLGDMDGIHDLEAAADMGVLLAKALCASLLYSPDMPDETRLRIGELVCEVTDSESGKKLQEMEIHEASDGLPADFPMPATDRIAFAKIKVVSGTAALDGINIYDKEPARIEADSLFATDEFKTAALFGDREGLQGYRELETPEFAEETIAEWRVRGNPWIDNIDQRKEL